MISNEECKIEIASFFREMIRSMKFVDIMKDPPSQESIFRLLETFSYDKDVVGKSISAIQSEIVTKTLHSRTGLNIERFHESVEGGYSTVIVRDKKVKEIGHSDMIWLHFSFTESGTIPAYNELQRILNIEEISYQLKVPEKIGPDVLVIGVYNKEDAKKILKYCSTNEIIRDSITINNPFMPRQNGIGVVKELKGKSYTHQLSELIHRYTLDVFNSMMQKKFPNPLFSLEALISFVEKEYTKSRTNASIFDRYLNYQVLLGLNCIKHDENYLEHVPHLLSITYKKDFYDKYKMSYTEKSIRYIDAEDNEITEENNYLLWLKLQAHSCIERMYYEKKNEIPKEDKVLGDNIIGHISEIVNKIMAGQPFFETLGYKDERITDLYPYLVGYYAYINKIALPEEVKYIVDSISNRIVHKTKVPGDNKEFYSAVGHTIPSTIPPIKLDNCLVGIEYIDYERNFCNISILTDDGVESFLSVFLDADKEKLWGEQLPKAALYRAILARILLDHKNLATEKTSRGPIVGDLLKIDGALQKLSEMVEELYDENKK